jgi:hypothetical protein
LAEKKAKLRLMNGIVEVVVSRDERPAAKHAAEKGGILGGISEKRASGAEAPIDSAGFMRGLKPPPPSVLSFSAAFKAVFLAKMYSWA